MNTTAPLPNETDVLIIGGGIWGLSTAYHLARTKKAGRVTLLERNPDLASETTPQAAGQIGQLRSHPVMVRAVRYTLDMFYTLHKETGYDPGLRTPGSLHLALCSERMDAFVRQQKAAVEFGVLVDVVGPEGVKRWAPDVNVANVVEAIYVEGDGYVDARQAALALASAARDLGAQCFTNTPVQSISRNSDGTWLVHTKQQTIHTRHVIVTAGPWTALLSETLGFTPPVVGLRLQQARTVARPTLPDRHPVVRIPDVSCYVRPEKAGYLFGYFDPEPLVMDPREQGGSFATNDVRPSPDLVCEAAERLKPVLPVLAELQIDEYRQGMVTCAPDGCYVLGPVPNHPGLWLATGCAGMGIAGCGAVGKWLADWIVEGDPGEDLQFLSPDRLKDLAADWNQLKAKCRRTFANYYSLRGGATFSMGVANSEN